MAWWDGLLGGGGGTSDPLDIYGDLFSEKQKAALAQRSAGEGLLKMAGAFGKAAQPSRMPTSFMGSLGEAAGALAGSGDEAANTALKGMEMAEKVKQARAERAILARAAPLVEAITKRLIGAGVPAEQATQIAAQVAGQQTTQQPPGAGGGGPNAPPPPPEVPGAPQPPGAPPLSALGMPQPRNNTAFGIPPRPGQPPLTPGQQNAGLLPPPRDQVLGPDGQPLIGPGVLPTMAASYGGGAGAPLPFARASSTPTGGGTPTAPGDDEWLRRNAPFSTQGGVRSPGAYAQGFTYDQPKVPFGQDPGDFLPGRRPSAGTPGKPAGGGGAAAGGGPRGQAVEYFTRRGWTPAQAAGIAANLEAESSWRPDVSGDGGNAVGYAQWHPPRQDDFRRVFGKDIRQATAEEQLAFVDWELNNTEKAAGDRLRGAASPRDAAEIVSRHYERPGDQEGNAARRGLLAEKINGGGQDVMLYSGRGIPASALRNVSDTGGIPGMPPSGGGGGFIPGTDVRPEELAALNAMLKMGGIKSDPFGSLLDTYYKSPGYLAEKARTETQAQKDVAYKMDPLIAAQTEAAKAKVEFDWKPKIEEAVQKLQSPILEDRLKAKAEIDRYSEMLKQDKQASLTPVDTTVADERGQPTATKITALEFAKRQQDRANRIARGDTTVKPGDIIGTPVLSPEETEVQKQRGKTSQEMREVDVWTPTGTVKQSMTNQEITARQALAAQRGAGGAPQIGDIVDKPSMTPTDQKLADALGEEFIGLRKQAVAADKTIRDTHNLRSKLDSGMFTGLDSNLNLFLARLGDTMGWKNLSDPEKVKNTETYIAGLGSEVLSLVSALRPASNIDLDFAKSMAGGQNLSAASIRQLLDMREEYARLAIQRHNEEAAGRNPAIFQGSRRELPMPPAYQPKELVTPSGNKARINR